MKKCDHFKDQILTDYIDGRLDKNAATILENHLLDCSDCRAFFKEVKSSAVSPFRQAGLQPVPSELWSSIRESIEVKEKTVNPLTNIIDQLKGWMVFPRLVPVFASFILMFLAGSVTLNTIQIQQNQAKDQGEYLVSLLSPADSTGLADSSDGSNPIEHYFL